jgi:hypothetical protein
MGDILMGVTQAVKTGILDVVGDGNVELGNAAAGDYFYFPNDGHTVLVLDCTSGDTFTFTAVNDPYGRTETLGPIVAAGKVAVLGPFMPELWNVTSGTYKGCVKFKPTTGNADDYLLAVKVTDAS